MKKIITILKTNDCENFDERINVLSVPKWENSEMTWMAKL